MCDNTVNSVPEWLNVHFLAAILQNHYKNEEITVINSNLKEATAKGASLLYRISVTFGVSLVGEENFHLILKKPSSNENVSGAFNKELLFFKEIVPKINEILDDIGEPEMFPEVFGVCETKNVVILGDLLAKDYQILPANRGYNISEAKVILKKMALFHGICAVLQEKDADVFANFKSDQLSHAVIDSDKIYADILKVVTDVISGWPELAVYSGKLRNLRGKTIERALQAYYVNPNNFNTLNHGSFCCSNLMVRTENGTEVNPFENVVLTHFQYAYWGSPANDLHYFLNTSINETYRPHRFDELVQFYHEYLVTFLTRLNYKKNIPSWSDFQKQYHDGMFFGFIVSCLLQPLQIDNNQNILLEELGNNEEGKRSLYEREHIRANLIKLIPYYDQLGIFD